MIKSIKNLLIKATTIALAIGLVWSMPHLKDHYYRGHIGSSVVKVIGVNGMGSGFHVQAPSGETYILTNAHVCALADQNRQLTIQHENRKVIRTVIAVYKNHDLCLVEKLPKAKSGIKIASSSDFGEDVYLIGHPSGRPLTLSKGELIFQKRINLMMNKSEKDCRGLYVPDMLFFQGGCVESFQAHGISTIAFPGNSGSPVVNKYGNLIGVLFAGSNQPTDSYMVPLRHIQAFLKDY